jgi:hypothetical protein
LSLRQTLVVPPNWNRSACLLFAPGAFDHEDEARQHLSTARLKLGERRQTRSPKACSFGEATLTVLRSGIELREIGTRFREISCHASRLYR